jgi:TonB family protein
MSVEANKSISDVWAKLEGRIVNSVLPLHRYLGSSDRSGVFLTESAKQEPTQVVLKLVPAVPTVAEAHLSRWLTATSLHHPHVLRIFEAGQCQIDGLHYLYAVMEYADQNLAQLLEHRALTEDEAREMLAPTLNALAFLHGRKLEQGRLKPSNILVVGDQIKLASDTIRPVGEATDSIKVISAYDPPEAWDGRHSIAGDIWALGVTLSEALTRRQPSGLHDGARGVVLPPDLSPTCREIVGWCLSRKADDRPKVAQIEAWVRGQHTGPAAPAAAPEKVAREKMAPEKVAPKKAPVGKAPAEKVAAEKVAAEVAGPDAALSESTINSAQPPVTRAAVSQDHSARRPSHRRAIPLTLGVVGAVALIWAGMAVVRTNPGPTSPAAEVTRDADSETQIPTPLPTSSEPAPVVSNRPVSLPVSSTSSAGSAEVEAAASPSEIHEVIPDVPRRASRTIRGHVRVSVRVIVDKEGTVFAALTDDPGPSRFFERLAIEAAKKWTFPPADTDAQRFMLVRFDFTRDGTTARARALE